MVGYAQQLELDVFDQFHCVDCASIQKHRHRKHSAVLLAKVLTESLMRCLSVLRAGYGELLHFSATMLTPLNFKFCQQHEEVGLRRETIVD